MSPQITPAPGRTESKSPPQILPCPFCGADWADAGGLIPWVECATCDASGPPQENQEAAIAAWNRRAAPQTAALPPPSAPVGVEGLHPETADLVRRFAQAIAEKLADAERKYGWDTHWKSPDWMDQCREQLVAHVAKGDPRDVAAYAAFLWHHGERTALAQQPTAVDEEMVERCAKAGWGVIPVGRKWEDLDPPIRANWRRIAHGILTAGLATQQGGRPDG